MAKSGPGNKASEVVVKKAKTKAPAAAEGEPIKLKVSKAASSSSKGEPAEAPSEKSKRKLREGPAAEAPKPDAAVEPEDAERPPKRTRGDAAKRGEAKTAAKPKSETKPKSEAKPAKAEKTKAEKAKRGDAEKADDDATDESPDASVSGAESGDDATPLLDLAVSLQDGRKTTVRALLDAGPDETDSIGFVVYPKASTPGCTKQCKDFSDQLQTFAQLGVAVVGVSLDSVASQRSFAKTNDLGLPLIADGSELLKRLRCLEDKKISRSVVAVDRHGNIFYEKHKVSPDSSARDFIAYLQARDEPPTEKDEEPTAKAGKKAPAKAAANKPASRPVAVAKEKKPKDAAEKAAKPIKSKEKAPQKVAAK